MNDLRQAAQQALEALEWHYRQGNSNTLGGWRLKIDEKALRDLKAALAEPEQEAEELKDPAEYDDFAAAIRHNERVTTRRYDSVGPVALETVYETIIHWDEEGGKRSRRELARRIVDLYTAPPQRKPLTDEQADQIISGLQTCHHQSSKREFLKVWLRDWAAHGIKEQP